MKRKECQNSIESLIVPCHLCIQEMTVCAAICRYMSCSQGQSHLYESLLRMSESPASRTANVEQRKSFPHAVPSSIYASVSVTALRESPSGYPIAEQLHSPKRNHPAFSQSSKADLQLKQLGGVSAYIGWTYIVTIEVMHGSFREHGVVFQLRLA